MPRAGFGAKFGSLESARRKISNDSGAFRRDLESPEVEKMISRSSYYSLAYAKNILKGRFIKGENAIKVNETCKQEYIRFLQRCLDDLTNLDEGTVESLEQTL